ncbi:MAG: cation transporter, partial [Anaerolineae bacterium]|nr:cation transporter [Anaerolineae bacterium]
MKKQDAGRPQQDEVGQSWGIAAFLWDGPKTLAEIAERFRSYPRLLGAYRITDRMERRHGRMDARLKAKMAELAALGWVVHEDDRYALTPLGRQEAEKPIADMRRTRALLAKAAQPRTVSAVGLAVHLGLAALKLPAALLSGSVGLLNDATDTLLDGLSSVLVYLGIRFDRERAVNIVLVLLMLGTGGFTFYEAVRRFFVPFEPDVDAFTFVATILSALICGALYLYQRFVGMRSGSIALITQSVDSRNHVIVAASVTAGLIAALLRFPLLDTLVGLAVAGLILKSAVELALETIRALGEGEVDLSRYEMGLAGWYDRFRQAQMEDWLLYLVEKQGLHAHTDLVERARQALDFSADPMLRELGVGQTFQTGEGIEASIAALIKRGWLAGDARLTVTDAGRARLSRQLREGTRR